MSLSPRDGVAAPADVLATVLGLLADVTGREARTLHPWQPFPEIGLDSLLGTEFVATVNARFGTAIKSAAVLDHPSLEAFALYVARETRCAAAPAPVTAPAAPPCRPLPSADELREELAQVLACDPWDLDPYTAFSDLGVDARAGAEFMRAVNRQYGLRERAVVLHDHPDLTALAAHLATA